MIQGGNRHLGDDELEQYSMGCLPESESGAFEEHILICEHCRLRLEGNATGLAANTSARAG